MIHGISVDETHECSANMVKFDGGSCSCKLTLSVESTLA